MLSLFLFCWVVVVWLFCCGFIGGGGVGVGVGFGWGFLCRVVEGGGGWGMVGGGVVVFV